MKRIFFGKSGAVNGHFPFWQPWGCLGCLWRVLLFMLMLLLLLFLLNLLQRCSNDDFSSIPKNRVELPKDLEQPDLPDDGKYVPDDEVVDSIPKESSRPRTIPGVPELPGEKDNRLKPVDDKDIITDPEDGMRQIVQGLLNVVFEANANDETIKSFAQQFKQLYPGDEYSIVFYNPYTKLLQIAVPETERVNVRENLPKQITGITFKVFDEEIMNQFVQPNDVGFKYPQISWHFEPIQAFDAWDITMGSKNVTIGIVDSYFDLSHSELRGDRIYKPYSVERMNSDVAPYAGIGIAEAGHGSMVASIAAGNANNGVGASGIAPKCRIIPVSVGAQITSSRQIEGILYAIYQGADVVNISIGLRVSIACPDLITKPVKDQVESSEKLFKKSEEVWDFVFKIAEERNVTIVWAAGNENVYTAIDASKRNPNTIRVSAVDQKLQKAKFSNYGNFEEVGLEESTISAPGVKILGAFPGEKYDCWDGTSFSAPIISGTVALMKSLNKSLTTKEIITILQETGKPVKGPNGTTIGKLVQIKDALEKVKESFMNFDDILKNPKNIIGLWESTDLMDAYFVQTGEFKDKFRLYMNITSVNGGEIIFKENSTGNTFNAPLSVKIKDDFIYFDQEREAVSDDHPRETYVIQNYKGKPDKDRLLKCYSLKNENHSFHLRKIK